MSAQALSFEQRLANLPFDPWLVASVCSLMVLGLIMVYSATIAMVGDGLSASASHLFRHLVYIGLGVTFMLIVARIDTDRLMKVDRLLLVFCLILLVAVLVPGLGVEVNGSRRWLQAGPFRMQPSELMKISFVMYFAAYLARQGETLQEFQKGIVVPGILLIVIGGLLIFEPDFGGVLVLVFTAGVMLFLSGMRLLHFFCCCFFALAGLSAAVFSEGYRVQRLVAFLDPWADPLGSGYQLTQALIAFGRGGWTGVGLGSSVQKLAYLPEANNDFLISIIAEELGVLGVAIVLVIYGIVLWRAFAIARRALQARKAFVARLAQGIGVLLTIQAIMNIGVNSGALPTTGLTLPFLGTGGSSLVSSCIAVGLLLACERSVRPGLRRRA